LSTQFRAQNRYALLLELLQALDARRRPRYSLSQAISENCCIDFGAKRPSDGRQMQQFFEIA
jgi:hypothetical protein